MGTNQDPVPLLFITFLIAIDCVKNTISSFITFFFFFSLPENGKDYNTENNVSIKLKKSMLLYNSFTGLSPTHLGKSLILYPKAKNEAFVYNI